MIISKANIPTISETYIVERNDTRVHIKLLSGNYLQATKDNQLRHITTLNQGGMIMACTTFELVIYANNLHGDFQLANESTNAFHSSSEP
ncbi:hypothetical protein KSP40_PGU016187 [Platanthera guangdongensis]|uniref:Uncharacterized protein n=1 Tax=Platanthera guangdongensis TaxID=2320717 RepID=A0ABR2MPQ6_9ASPA